MASSLRHPPPKAYSRRRGHEGAPPPTRAVAIVRRLAAPLFSPPDPLVGRRVRAPPAGVYDSASAAENSVVASMFSADSFLTR